MISAKGKNRNTDSGDVKEGANERHTSNEYVTTTIKK
jgi:hypothetical protein